MPPTTTTKRKKSPVSAPAKGIQIKGTTNADSTEELLLKRMEGLKGQLTETREQLAYVYGALEEIAQRQELQSSWQLDFARRILLSPISFSHEMPQPASIQPDPDSPMESDDPRGPLHAPSPESLITSPEDTGNPFEEILTSAEMLFKRLNSRHKSERARGLRTMERILKKKRGAEKEPMFIILPAKMDLH